MTRAPMLAYKAKRRSNAGFSRKSSSLRPNEPQTEVRFESRRPACLPEGTAHREIPYAGWRAIPDGESGKRRIVSARRLSYCLASSFGVRLLRLQSLDFCANAWTVAAPGALIGNGAGISCPRPSAKGDLHG